jgi:anthranilate phosphoribosyltransferase
VLSQFTDQLKRGQSLSAHQVAVSVEELVQEQGSVEEKAAFLSALAAKGETVEEIAAFAHALRERSVRPELDRETRARTIMDVCGTGGDRMSTFNISTAVAIVVSAAGVTVAKHGNRAVTSQSGSADVLDALGIRTDLTPEEAGYWLRDYHFAFFFAPLYHPAFRHIAPARKWCAEKGQRTIFNFLGPLLNPARPTAQLIGLPRPELCEPIARVLKSLGIRSGMVVSGKAGTGYLDEISILGDNCAAGFGPEEEVRVVSLAMEGIPLRPALLADLAGGDRQANGQILRAILTGRERGPQRDAVLLNAAAAFIVAGQASGLRAGWDLAGNVIDNGSAAAQLERLIAASVQAPRRSGIGA